jgi:hypothetical protein
MAPQIPNDFRQRFVHFYLSQVQRSKSKAVKAFESPIFNRRTLYRILSDFEKTGSVKLKPRTGRKGNKMARQNARRVRTKFEKNPGKTVTKVAAELKMKRSTVGYVKLKVCGLKARSKKPAPKYTEEQAARAKRNCRKIYRNRILSGSSKIVILDDESYFPLDPSDLSYRQFYHAATPGNVCPSERTKGKAKFFQKVMVWQAIDEKGNRSEPCFFQGTINGDVYLKECIRKRLIPFIKKYHKVEDVLFWPDLASCHYTEAVRNELDSAGIDYIGKHENAPNVPQARPIEIFWGVLKKKYLARKKSVKNLNGFKRVYRQLDKSFTKKSAQELMRQLRRNVRKIGYEGVLATY